VSRGTVKIHDLSRPKQLSGFQGGYLS